MMMMMMRRKEKEKRREGVGEGNITGGEVNCSVELGGSWAEPAVFLLSRAAGETFICAFERKRKEKEKERWNSFELDYLFKRRKKKKKMMMMMDKD